MVQGTQEAVNTTINFHERKRNFCWKLILNLKIEISNPRLFYTINLKWCYQFKSLYKNNIVQPIDGIVVEQPSLYTASFQKRLKFGIVKDEVDERHENFWTINICLVLMIHTSCALKFFSNVQDLRKLWTRISWLETNEQTKFFVHLLSINLSFTKPTFVLNDIS